MKITINHLEQADACQGQKDLFTDLFPDGVEVTEEVCREHSQVFDWEWAVWKLLTEEQQAEYRAVQQPVYAEYLAACAVAFARAWNS